MLLLRSWGNENLKRLREKISWLRIWWSVSLGGQEARKSDGKPCQIGAYSVQAPKIGAYSCSPVCRAPKKMRNRTLQRAVGINWFSRVRKLAWLASAHVPFSSFNAWHGELLPTYQHQCAPALKVQEGSHCFLVDLQNSQQTTTNSGEFTKKCMYVTPQTNK